MPLTDVAIRKAKPGEKPIKLSDGRRLYLEIAPSGGKWWWLPERRKMMQQWGDYLDKLKAGGEVIPLMRNA